MNFFEDTSRQIEKDCVGWYHEGPQTPILPDRSVTAVNVLALDRINRMLDERINARVFRHFSVKEPRVLSKSPHNLTNLFYPDYGLAMAPQPVRRESVVFLLERMRAHVAGVSAFDSRPSLYSIVLHGPGGTGKTTFVEALAASCRVPLVEVTPSDIVVGGEEAVERRTRAVFKALSLLTRTVISFDEFEPVLWRRDPGASTPRSVFAFLTPGMLPKLKTLNKSAARRSVAYALITNLIGSLDGPAIRDGRFDYRAGIYPPDPLSRTGRLYSELFRYRAERRRAEPAFEFPSDLNERVQRVVRGTRGGSMQTLGRPGWFTAPSGRVKLPIDAPFYYLCGGGAARESWCTAEAKLEKAGSGDYADLEYQQWKWVIEWDDIVDKAPLEKSLSTLPEV